MVASTLLNLRAEHELFGSELRGERSDDRPAHVKRRRKPVPLPQETPTDSVE